MRAINMKIIVYGVYRLKINFLKYIRTRCAERNAATHRPNIVPKQIKFGLCLP